MNNQKIYMLNSTGRVCYDFPWESGATQPSWNTSTHMRVVIPYTQRELAFAKGNKRAHVQVVRRNKVTEFRTSFKLPRSATAEA